MSANRKSIDWRLVPNERHLDVTHEVGLTRQSPTSLLTLRYGTSG